MNILLNKASALVALALMIAPMTGCDTSDTVSTGPSSTNPLNSAAITGMPMSCPTGETSPGWPICSTWTDATYRHYLSNQLPNHCVATDYHFDIKAQPLHDFKIPVSITKSDAIIPMNVCDTPPQRFGIAINGVVFDPEDIAIWIKEKGCIENDATKDCGGTRWQVDAAIFDDPARMCSNTLDMDDHLGHTQDSGKYHYHKLTAQTVAAITHVKEEDLPKQMTLVGWSFDGYPVYWKYGRVSKDAPLLTMKSQYTPTGVRMTSAYDTLTMPKLDKYAKGVFTNDWVFDPKSTGDEALDECNGRMCYSAELGRVSYCYFLTDQYPYIPRCHRAVSFEK